jgi:hypothetical protein
VVEKALRNFPQFDRVALYLRLNKININKMSKDCGGCKETKNIDEYRIIKEKRTKNI